MPSLNEVYVRLQKAKKEKAEISKMLKGELQANARYVELGEEMKNLRDEKRRIENEVRNFSKADVEKLEGLKADIQTDTELLADQALNMYVKGETVEIVDEDESHWYPQFSVRFKRGA